MKNERRILTALLMVMVLGFSAFASACSKDDADDTPEPTEVSVYMTLDLPSDSDNGDTWKFEQDKKLFECEDSFLVDEGSGEVQSFEMKPVAAGNGVLTFTNGTRGTTYTYEVEVGKDSSIKVTSSKGVTGDEDVEAPKPVVEKD